MNGKFFLDTNIFVYRLIIAAALESQCGILLTEDLIHGQRFGRVQVQNPFL